MTITLGGVTLPNVRTIRLGKLGNISQIQMPLQDDTSADVIDTYGVTSIVTIEGVFTSKAEQDSVLAILDGEQDLSTFSTGNTYISDKTGMIQSIEVIWDVPGFKADYSIKFLVGTIN